MKRSNVLSFLLVSFFGATIHGASSNSEAIKSLKKLYERPASVPYPQDNPYTKEKEELGRILFFDPRLSSSNMLSCASCHNPSFSWGDGLAKGIGHAHKELGRRTPTILNLAWGARMFWDGRAANLEAQALGPIESEGEMNQKIEGSGGLIEKLKAIPSYAAYFKAAFPKDADPITAAHIGQAIATFERAAAVSGKSRFDDFVAGNDKALNASEKNGFLIFNTKGNCQSCHSGWNFTDNSFQDIGVPGDDIGRSKVLPKLPSMIHAFKTPTLRNVAERAPYMHDGSEKTLEDVIELYDMGGRVKRETMTSLVRPLNLTKEEKSDLVAFLKTLSSKDKLQHLPVLPK